MHTHTHTHEGKQDIMYSRTGIVDLCIGILQYMISVITSAEVYNIYSNAYLYTKNFIKNKFGKHLIQVPCARTSFL